MAEVKVYHYDAFSAVPGKGNPAGVVFDADDLSEMDMQQIAYKVGFNETVFVLNSRTADVRLRYFTPGHEINLCGHATMASLYGLKKCGLLGDQKSITIETNVGLLPIRFEQDGDTINMEMKQDQPQFVPFRGDIGKLANSINLTSDDLDLSMPIVYGSTGTWTLLIPIRKLNSFSKMKSESAEFPEILLENPKASLHPFSFETRDSESMMHARHFSSPYSGTTEDPVTGTASGVMGAYYLTYVNRKVDQVKFVVEQGHEIGRDGKVEVSVTREGDGMDVRIKGTAVFVREMNIELDI
ncbi:PhzF family phenazine biosynthesis isomerase [Paenibacillus illinoisensis]|uniref:Phenazine biosynthesis protein PhzF family protein n=1 Tax=Paenibacillus illinoisensis TaxID=59845 RepID=A0A2W0CIQ4_9BACL|nr:PhzF family phenazine biosynthesis isomerase [Paenibacillus illinoisensis]PYY29932.1 Phenazine biosynthesis protein PhzF family protein [Paenibacillus illinoisensis]